MTNLIVSVIVSGLTLGFFCWLFNVDFTTLTPFEKVVFSMLYVIYGGVIKASYGDSK